MFFTVIKTIFHFQCRIFKNIPFLFPRNRSTWPNPCSEEDPISSFFYTRFLLFWIYFSLIHFQASLLYFLFFDANFFLQFFFCGYVSVFFFLRRFSACFLYALHASFYISLRLLCTFSYWYLWRYKMSNSTLCLSMSWIYLLTYNK